MVTEIITSHTCINSMKAVMLSAAFLVFVTALKYVVADPRFQSTTITLMSSRASSLSVNSSSHIGGDPVGRKPWITKVVGLDKFNWGLADRSEWDSSMPQLLLSLVYSSNLTSRVVPMNAWARFSLVNFSHSWAGRRKKEWGVRGIQVRTHTYKALLETSQLVHKVSVIISDIWVFRAIWGRRYF